MGFMVTLYLFVIKPKNKCDRLCFLISQKTVQEQNLETSNKVRGERHASCWAFPVPTQEAANHPPCAPLPKGRGHLLPGLASATLSWLFSRSVVSNSFVTPWTVARQAALPMELSMQEYWKGLHFSSYQNRTLDFSCKTSQQCIIVQTTILFFMKRKAYFMTACATQRQIWLNCSFPEKPLAQWYPV